MKYTEQERQEIAQARIKIAQARIKRERTRANTEKIVLWFEILIGIITLLFLIIALSH